MVRWPRIYIWSGAPYLCKEMSDFKKKNSSGLLETCLINHLEHIFKKHQIRSRLYNHHHHHQPQMAKCMPFEMQFYLKRNISGEKIKHLFTAVLAVDSENYI